MTAKMIVEMGTLRLGVNVDHIATLRQARYATMPASKNAEPDPVAAASICERAGAHGITAHLRADRRHIQDRDMERLRANIMTKLNFEMGNTPEILDVAIRTRPDEVCLVPEKRAEVTTEGGLDAIASRRDLANTIQRLHANGIRVSLFIDPDEKQIDCATELGVEMIELHTGKLANAFTEKIEAQELDRLSQCARHAHGSKLQVNAGHGINYRNIALIHKIRPRHRFARNFCGLGKRCAPNAGINGELQRMSAQAGSRRKLLECGSAIAGALWEPACKRCAVGRAALENST